MAFQRTFLVPAGQSLDTNVQWMVRSILINNFTSQWYVVQPWNLKVPPGVQGITFDYPVPSQNIKVVPTTYQGQANFIFSGDTLEVSVFDEAIGSSGGNQVIALDTRSALFTALPGAAINTGTLSFPAIGCRIDNQTGTWYTIGATGINIPPWTTGFTLDILPPITAFSLTVQATPPYGTNAATGTQVAVTLYAKPIGNYGGSTQAPTSKPFFVQIKTAALLQVTLNPVAVAGDLMVAVVSLSGSATIAPPAGWTIIQQTNAALSYLTAYKYAVGGEGLLVFTGNASALAVATYRGFAQNIFVPAQTTTQTATVTPANIPAMVIGLYNGNANAAITSPNTTLRGSLLSTGSGVAISDAYYTTSSNEIVTFVQTGATVFATVAGNAG